MTDIDHDSALEHLLGFLRDSRSLDFTGYKRPSLTRRIRKRMQAVHIATFDDYRDYLEVHPDEHVKLLDTILINVTSFYRDPDAWNHLADEIVPKLVADKAPDEPIRIWSAGCATGEEAYTVAMVFAEHLGVEKFTSRVKIYATDTDEAALTVARSGLYTRSQLDGVPDEIRDRYFEPSGDEMAFRSDLRRSVIFGAHDITTDAPISRLDLLVCRNVLMYLVRDTQRSVLSRFHYALGPGGRLFLGKAETIFAHADYFTPLSTRFRIFERSTDRPDREQLLAMAPGAAAAQMPSLPTTQPLLDLAAAATPVAQLVVDLDGTVVEANNKARMLFGVTSGDLGRKLRDLEVSYRPVELRAQIERAHAEAGPVVLRNIQRPLPDGQAQFFEVTISPLTDPSGMALGTSVTYANVTELGRLTTELERSRRDLELANERLHSVNEELETSNEELQSTNEELETTNEELQSANEELETMNEELQSANEELETMNEELLDQAQQIEQSAEFLSLLLDSLAVGVVVVDEAFTVTMWNRAMRDLFGVGNDEAVGRPLTAVDSGLPVDDIAPHLHEFDEASDRARHTLTLDAVDRRGRTLRCRITIDALADPSGQETASTRFAVIVDPLEQLDA
jgi:two-component system CheB/CheR fusion protein